MFEEQARVRDTMSQSDATKVEAVPNVHVIEVMSDEVSPAYHGTKQSFFGTVHRYRWALTWCLYMLWCVLANNYAKLAGPISTWNSTIQEGFRQSIQRELCSVCDVAIGLLWCSSSSVSDNVHYTSMILLIVPHQIYHWSLDLSLDCG